MLAGIVSLCFLSGCGSARKKQSLLDQKQAPSPVVVVNVDTAAAAAKPDTTALLCERMIRRAKAYCGNEQFHAADSLFRQVISLLGDNSGQFVQDSTFSVDACMNEIVASYSELPPDSIDVPEEIAHLVFQNQMFLSLDSIEFSTEDSAVLEGFVHRQDVQYDIPVVWNSRVQRSLHYYLSRSNITIDVWRKRSNIYLPFMKRMFADSSLPQDLAYLPLIESGFNPRAYSRAHASGIWQFIRSTGKLYGLRTNYWFDERRDPVRSTAAAIRYLKKLYGDFGHWYLALAAYNCGEGGLARTIEKCGTGDYWQLRLPQETMNYVPFYLAALTIAKSNLFAVEAAAVSETVPFDTVSIGECIAMRDIADGVGLPPDTLKALNPHILRWCTPPDMTDVLVYLPSGYGEKFRAFYAELPDEKKVRWYRYRVRPGDNLGSIARHFRLPVQGIKSVNNIRGSRIIAGKHLFIPIPVGREYAAPPEMADRERRRMVADAEVPENAKLTVYEVKKGDTVWRLAEIFGVSAEQICGWNTLEDARIKAGDILSIYTAGRKAKVSGDGEKEPVKRPAPAGTMDYVIRRGDNLFRIARQFGMAIDQLYALNGIDAGKILHPGDILLVRKVGNAAMVSSAGNGSRSQPDGTLAYVVSAGDNLYRIARNFQVTVERIRRLNNLTHSAVIRAGDTLFIPGPDDAKEEIPRTAMKESGYYMVKSGDNLWRIADLFDMPVEQLYKLNNLQSTSVLMPGDTLRVIMKGEM